MTVYLVEYIFVAAVVVTAVIGVFLVIKFGQASPLADEYTMRLRRHSVVTIFGLGSALTVVLVLGDIVPDWLQAAVIIAVIAAYVYLLLDMRKAKHASQ